MKTMVVLDETIITYLLHLVERYGFQNMAINSAAKHQLDTALKLLEQARAADEARRKEEE